MYLYRKKIKCLSELSIEINVITHLKCTATVQSGMLKAVDQKMIVFCHAGRTSSQEQQNHSQDHLHPPQCSKL